MDAVILTWYVAVTSLCSNGSTAFLWKLCCHWIKGLWYHHITSVVIQPTEGNHFYGCYIIWLNRLPARVDHIVHCASILSTTTKCTWDVVVYVRDYISSNFIYITIYHHNRQKKINHVCVSDEIITLHTPRAQQKKIIHSRMPITINWGNGKRCLCLMSFAHVFSLIKVHDV